MMEAAYSLMQMAKTSARLSLLSKKGIPYISLLTDPTTGGITASFAMLGDLNIAEPGALIGFAGPRVIKETIGKELPKGFSDLRVCIGTWVLGQDRSQKGIEAFHREYAADVGELRFREIQLHVCFSFLLLPLVFYRPFQSHTDVSDIRS
jgi:hypothetical protein